MADDRDTVVGVLLGVAAAAAIGYFLSKVLGSTPPRCPQCGAYISNDARSCRNCGARL